MNPHPHPDPHQNFFLDPHPHPHFFYADPQHWFLDTHSIKELGKKYWSSAPENEDFLNSTEKDNRARFSGFLASMDRPGTN